MGSVEVDCASTDNRTLLICEGVTILSAEVHFAARVLVACSQYDGLHAQPVTSARHPSMRFHLPDRRRYVSGNLSSVELRRS